MENIRQAKNAEERLRFLVERHLSDHAITNKAGVYACRATVGDTIFWKEPKNRFDLSGIYDGHSKHYGSLSISTYRPNAPRYAVSSEGEVAPHQERPRAVFKLRENDGVEQVFQDDSGVALSPTAVDALVDDLRTTEHLHPPEFTQLHE